MCVLLWVREIMKSEIRVQINIDDPSLYLITYFCILNCLENACLPARCNMLNKFDKIAVSLKSLNSWKVACISHRQIKVVMFNI